MNTSHNIDEILTTHQLYNILTLQQQEIMDTFIKPIGDLSQDGLYHESPAVLPIGEQMAMNDLTLGPTFIIHPFNNVIKDDVFLAQASTVDHDDTASLSSLSSIMTSPPTQCLEPTNDLLFGTDMMLPLEDTKRKKTIEPKKKQLIKDNKTVFQHLTERSIDWCRYCGTTEGVNWRPGPWGKRTLCNKHGCDYKGYGLASRMPRLDLSMFLNESLKDRKRPVIQQFCIQCQLPETKDTDRLIMCDGGCSRAYHQQCYTSAIDLSKEVRWYCSAVCKENRKRNKVVVELPRKHIPFMHLLSKS